MGNEPEDVLLSVHTHWGSTKASDILYQHRCQVNCFDHILIQTQWLALSFPSECGTESMMNRPARRNAPRSAHYGNNQSRKSLEFLNGFSCFCINANAVVTSPEIKRWVRLNLYCCDRRATWELDGQAETEEHLSVNVWSLASVKQHKLGEDWTIDRNYGRGSGLTCERFTIIKWL